MDACFYALILLDLEWNNQGVLEQRTNESGKVFGKLTGSKFVREKWERVSEGNGENGRGFQSVKLC